MENEVISLLKTVGTPGSILFGFFFLYKGIEFRLGLVERRQEEYLDKLLSKEFYEARHEDLVARVERLERLANGHLKGD